MDKYVPVVLKRLVAFLRYPITILFKECSSSLLKWSMWSGKAADSSNLLGTCIFAIMVIGTKQHFELKTFNFCGRLDTVILIYYNSLQGLLL